MVITKKRSTADDRDWISAYQGRDWVEESTLTHNLIFCGVVAMGMTVMAGMLWYFSLGA